MMTTVDKENFKLSFQILGMVTFVGVCVGLFLGSVLGVMTVILKFAMMVGG